MPVATTLSMVAPSGLTAGPVQTRNGNTYAIDANGYVAEVEFIDVPDLLGAGFTVAPLLADRTNQFLGKLLGANMNVTTDQAITLATPAGAASGTSLYVDKIVITNASISLTTAAGGFYSAASKGGSAIVAAAQAYSGLTTALLAIEATIAVRLRQTTPVLYLSLTTGQGAAATADVYVFGTVLG